MVFRRSKRKKKTFSNVEKTTGIICMHEQNRVLVSITGLSLPTFLYHCIKFIECSQNTNAYY